MSFMSSSTAGAALRDGFADVGAVAVDTSSHTVWVTNGNRLAYYKGDFANKPPKCGGGGVTIG